MSDVTAPKGPWQRPHPGLAVCDRHNNVCAYRTGDPERCDYCHASFDAIEHRWQDAEPRQSHLAKHERADELRLRKRQNEAS